MKSRGLISLIAGFGLVLSTSLAHAVPIELITNGGFETGNFTGWTTASSGSALGWTINDGTFNPPGPGVPLAPISGSFDAMSQQTGPGQNLLMSQLFVVPTGITSAILSWSDRIRNFASVFSDPNQEFRVLIEDSVGALIQEVFSTNPGDPLQQVGPNLRSFDLTSLFQPLQGQTVQLSFEQQDNLFFFNATVDDVSLVAVVPEPSTLALFGIGLAGLGWIGRRRKKNS